MTILKATQLEKTDLLLEFKSRGDRDKFYDYIKKHLM